MHMAPVARVCHQMLRLRFELTTEPPHETGPRQAHVPGRDACGLAGRTASSVPRAAMKRDGPRRKAHTFECAGCRRQTSVTAGTILHASKLPLTVWFWAVMATHSNGISALQLQKQLGILLPQRLAARPQAARQHGRPRAQPCRAWWKSTSLPFRTKDDPPTGGPRTRTGLGDGLADAAASTVSPQRCGPRRDVVGRLTSGVHTPKWGRNDHQVTLIPGYSGI